MSSPYSALLEKELKAARKTIASYKRRHRKLLRTITKNRYGEWNGLKLAIEEQRKKNLNLSLELSVEKRRERLFAEQNAARTRRKVSVGLTQQMKLVIQDARSIIDGRLAGVPLVDDNDMSNAAQYARYYRLAATKLVEQLHQEFLVEIDGADDRDG